MSYGVRQLIPGVFSPAMNVGKPYSSTLKPEKEKINTYYVNLINGLYIIDPLLPGVQRAWQRRAPALADHLLSSSHDIHR